MITTINALVNILLSLLLITTVFTEDSLSKNSVNIADEQDIIDMIQQIDESMVFNYVDGLTSFGPRYTGSINCTLAGEYIYNEFLNMGLETDYHEWKVDIFQSKNIVATLLGYNPHSNVEILYTAHYDTVKCSPGANDDASGVAAVMAAAKVMSQYSFQHTVRFIAFSGEEVGTYGSFSYARDAYRNGDNIYAVINPDIIGYAHTIEGGKLIRFMCPENSGWITDYAINVSFKYQSYIDMRVEKRPNYIGADHQPFIDYGYNGVWISHHDGYSWCHTPEDTIDKLNFSYEVKAARFLCSLVAEFAIDDIAVQVVFNTPYEGYCYFGIYPVFPLDLPKTWYIGLRGATLIFGQTKASVTVYTDLEIETVIFCIDSNFMVWDWKEPYEWTIEGKHFPPIGRHLLSVYAYTKDGKIAEDHMEIIIFTMACQYG